LQSNQTWAITWYGDHISLNAWYSAKHWSIRATQRTKWHKWYGEIVKEQQPSLLLTKINQYEIYLTYRSRLDPSNTITMVKLFEDYLQEVGVLEGDDRKHCKGVHLIPDDDWEDDKSYCIKIVQLV